MRLPIHNHFGLTEAFNIFEEEEGIAADTDRHQQLASDVRAPVEAWCREAAIEFNAVNEHERSDSVTCVRVSADYDANQVIKVAREKYNLTMGSGIGPLAGSAFRIGHLADLTVPIVLGALGALEQSLRTCRVPIGSGGLEAAAQQLSEASR